MTQPNNPESVALALKTYLASHFSIDPLYISIRDTGSIEASEHILNFPYMTITIQKMQCDIKEDGHFSAVVHEFLFTMSRWNTNAQYAPETLVETFKEFHTANAETEVSDMKLHTDTYYPIQNIQLTLKIRFKDE